MSSQLPSDAPLRILVTGATGYVGGRLVPRLVSDGHQVRTTFTDPHKPKPWWTEELKGSVKSQQMDVMDPDQVRRAVKGMHAVYYLVHGMGGEDFVEKDRQAAKIMSEAITQAGVRRVIYLSGIVPDVADDELSDHISSRLEVERILAASEATAIALRAAVLIGSGSTSFEIIRQVSERMPVQTVPTWMDSDVQPIAIVDAIEALVGALAPGLTTRSYDVGGPERLSYGSLLDRYADLAGLTRPQVMIPLLPAQLVGKLVGALTDVPTSTVEALVESLHEDMVCAEDDFTADLLPADYSLMGLDEAITRALTQTEAAEGAGSDLANRDPMGPMPQDPHWAEGGTQLSPVAKIIDVAKGALGR